ncbi:hypothetical protein DFH09DRAFT_1163837 [Mycena vulgaris]|nr:hypothetical protein DFH09DRAFT_1163837 [Mycena vulgaris]
MSFIGLGDIVLVTTLTWSLYKCCKEASEDFRRMSIELMSLHAVLGETRDYLQEYGEGLEESRKYRLGILLDGCQSPLEDLDALYRRYDSLSTQTQRSWDRMRFGLKDLSDVRQRLVTSTTLLTSFNTALINSSTARIEKKLNRFIAEVQAGMREGSVISTSDVAIQSPDVWDELRRELEDVGISAAVIEERHDFIVNWLKKALDDGSLEENARVVGIDDVGISSLSLTVINTEGSSSRSPTLVNDVEQDSSYHTADKDWTHESSKRNNSLPPPFSSSSSQTPRPVVRRRTFGLVERLLQKQTAIVKAASDGDIDRVGRLISVGMDVNAVDRWGWSALSMCGYGGYPDIARLLLDHGANIDNVDVDGDTPKSLAAQRGHADLVIMFEEEEAIRKLRAIEVNQGAKST